MEDQWEQIGGNDRLLNKIIQQVGDNVMITDREAVILYVNPAFEKTTGYSKEEVLGQNPRILQSGEHGEAYYARLWSTILSGNIFNVHTTNKNKRGELFIADQTISPIKDDSGEITHFISVWRDITEIVKAEEEMKRLRNQVDLEKRKLEQVLNIESHLSTIFDLHKLVDFIVNNTTAILEAQRCSIMFIDENSGELCVKGYKGIAEELITARRLKIGDPIAGIIALEGKSVLVTDIEKDRRFSREKGSSYKSKSFISAPIKLGEKLIGVISLADKCGSQEVFTEIDLKILCMIVRQAAIAIENAKMYRQLNYLTVTDPITNIHNYRYFIQKLDYEIKRARRYERAVCIVMVDVDNYKPYNDDFGHLEGDRLLREIAKILEENLREVDVVCRYTGDEFALILPETKPAEAEVVGKKIMEKISGLSLKRKITLSLGVAQYSSPMDRAELILKADAALSSAKREGKNKICVNR
jgi:diguanylate cyclase (GGDEF)-like protein/PAS domain S-box-containing protein